MRNYYTTMGTDECGILCYRSIENLVKGKLLSVYYEGTADWLPEEFRQSVMQIYSNYTESLFTQNPIDFMLEVIRDVDVKALLGYYGERCCKHVNTLYHFSSVDAMQDTLAQFSELADCVLRVYRDDVCGAAVSNGGLVVSQFLNANYTADGAMVYNLSLQENVRLYVLLKEQPLNGYSSLQDIVSLMKCRNMIAADVLSAAIVAAIIKWMSLTEVYENLADVMRSISEREATKCLTL